jgi:hypothetical protein
MSDQPTEQENIWGPEPKPLGVDEKRKRRIIAVLVAVACVCGLAWRHFFTNPQGLREFWVIPVALGLNIVLSTILGGEVVLGGGSIDRRHPAVLRGFVLLIGVVLLAWVIFFP